MKTNTYDDKVHGRGWGFDESERKKHDKKNLGFPSPGLHVHQFRSLQILCSSIINITFNLNQSVNYCTDLITYKWK